MKTTKVFHENIKAYNEGCEVIANKGGTRSSKTFSVLQLLLLVAEAKKKVIHVVSHSTPHLKDGAIADFEKILIGEGYKIDEIRTQNPHTYKINNSVIKFIGFDKIGKALGAARNILFVNEANKMPWEIVDHLMIRTTDVTFIDWNPSATFWFEEKGLDVRPTTRTIVSTFKDNYDNLTEKQINELKYKKQKHDEEKLNGVNGYFYNWWRVYGRGLTGSIQGAVFNNWRKIEEHEIKEFDNVPVLHGVDWGYEHPTTLTKFHIDFENKRIYINNFIYQTKLSTSVAVERIANYVNHDDRTVCDTNNKQGNIDLTDVTNVIPAIKKGAGMIYPRIQRLQDFELLVNPKNIEVIKELENYSWSDNKRDYPIDDHNHVIDPLGYCITYADIYYR